MDLELLLNLVAWNPKQRFEVAMQLVPIPEEGEEEDTSAPRGASASSSADIGAG